jgi:glutathione S-transferase
VGSSWTIADFVLASHFFNYYFNEANEFHAQFKAVLDTFPHLSEYALNLQHEFKDYLAARPVRPF